MAAKLYEINSLLFEVIEDNYHSFKKSQLIRLNLLFSIFVKHAIQVSTVQENNKLYFVLPNRSIHTEVQKVLLGLGYIVENGRVRIL